VDLAEYHSHYAMWNKIEHKKSDVHDYRIPVSKNVFAKEYVCMVRPKYHNPLPSNK